MFCHVPLRFEARSEEPSHPSEGPHRPQLAARPCFAADPSVRSLKGRCFGAWSTRCHQVRRALGGFQGLAASLSASGLRLCLQQWHASARRRAWERAEVGRLATGLERLLQGGALVKLRWLLQRMQHQRQVLELLQGSCSRSLQRRCVQLWQLSARQRGSAQGRLRGSGGSRNAWLWQVCAAIWSARCFEAFGAFGPRRRRAAGRRGMPSTPWRLAWAACGRPWSSAGSSSIAATCGPTAG